MAIGSTSCVVDGNGAPPPILSTVRLTVLTTVATDVKVAAFRPYSTPVAAEHAETITPVRRPDSHCCGVYG